MDEEDPEYMWQDGIPEYQMWDPNPAYHAPYQPNHIPIDGGTYRSPLGIGLQGYDAGLVNGTEEQIIQGSMPTIQGSRPDVFPMAREPQFQNIPFQGHQNIVPPGPANALLEPEGMPIYPMKPYMDIPNTRKRKKRNVQSI